MEEKGYSTIHDFRGKLKPYAKVKKGSKKEKKPSGTGTSSNDTVPWKNGAMVILLAIIAYLVLHYDPSSSKTLSSRYLGRK